MKIIAIIGGVILLSGLFTTRVMAADRFLTGSLAVETPFGISPDRPQDHSLMALGTLKLHNFLPNVNLFTAGQLQFRTGNPFDKENKALVGVEYVLPHGITPYVYYQRWYDINDNRLVAGVRLDFKSAKF